MRPFPAHAGMNPRTPALRVAAKPVPRARGDEPDGRIITSVTVEPFPAHAGMNRAVLSADGRLRPVPRARGDEPADKIGAKEVGYRSPRTRG